mmetsp:Transcript_112581/g.223804  ORF Transcript_112581/g.223804 Transcript_112581/m.223804 type:complete len:240 (-) Transcript_112581:70-789(-)
MPTRLYVGNLDQAQPPEKEEIERKFRKYGRVIEVWVSRNPGGYAFVTFDSFKDALKAIDDLDCKNFLGRQLNIQLSMGKGGGKAASTAGMDWVRSPSRSPGSSCGRRSSRSCSKRNGKRRCRSRSFSPRARSSPSYGREAPGKQNRGRCSTHSPSGAQPRSQIRKCSRSISRRRPESPNRKRGWSGSRRKKDRRARSRDQSDSARSGHHRPARKRNRRNNGRLSSSASSQQRNRRNPER